MDFGDVILGIVDVGILVGIFVSFYQMICTKKRIRTNGCKAALKKLTIFGIFFAAVWKFGLPNEVYAVTKQLPLADLEMNQLCIQAGNLCAYYKDEDGINQKAVLKNGKWNKEMVKDSYVKKEGKKEYFTVFPDKSGYVEAAPDAKTIKRHNAKGKTVKTIKIKNAKTMPAVEKILSVKSVEKNRILLLVREKKTMKNTAVMAAVKSGKILWKKRNIGDDCVVVKNKIYAYRYQKKAEKTDVLSVYSIKDGKKEKTQINLSEIRSKVRQLKGEEAITDTGFTFAESDGKLYAGYCSGIYEVKKNGTMKLVIDGEINHFSEKQVIDFVVTKSAKKVYLLMSNESYDGEAGSLLACDVATADRIPALQENVQKISIRSLTEADLMKDKPMIELTDKVQITEFLRQTKQVTGTFNFAKTYEKVRSGEHSELGITFSYESGDKMTWELHGNNLIIRRSKLDKNGITRILYDSKRIFDVTHMNHFKGYVQKIYEDKLNAKNK